MRDDGLSPGQFHGGLDENGSEWLRQLQNYCAFRGFDDVKSLALMKVLLTDAAGNWVEFLDEKSMGTYAALMASFKSRYMQPDALKYIRVQKSCIAGNKNATSQPSHTSKL